MLTQQRLEIGVINTAPVTAGWDVEMLSLGTLLCSVLFGTQPSCLMALFSGLDTDAAGIWSGLFSQPLYPLLATPPTKLSCLLGYAGKEGILRSELKGKARDFVSPHRQRLLRTGYTCLLSQ